MLIHLSLSEKGKEGENNKYICHTNSLARPLGQQLNPHWMEDTTILPEKQYAVQKGVKKGRSNEFNTIIVLYQKLQ